MSIIIAMLTLWGAYAHADDDTSTETRRRSHEPPPEAYAAFEDKNAGDTAQLAGPRGETKTGTCESTGDRLVLRPDRLKGRSGGRRHGPPPEAYTVCED